uniref:Uncharacterized protein n=1 Tax=Globodera rostochiensis TaxID=31243 RepID=A0A914I1A6_GLORO
MQEPLDGARNVGPIGEEFVPKVGSTGLRVRHQKRLKKVTTLSTFGKFDLWTGCEIGTMNIVKGVILSILLMMLFSCVIGPKKEEKNGKPKKPKKEGNIHSPSRINRRLEHHKLVYQGTNENEAEHEPKKHYGYGL